MLDEKTTLDVATEPTPDSDPLTSGGFAKLLEVTLDDEPTEDDAEPVEDDEVEDEEAVEDEAEEADEVDEEADEPDEVKKPSDQPAEKVLTEAQVNAIVAERLARDRKTKLVQEIEALEGKSLEDVLAERRKAKIETVADQYGMTEDEAKEHVEAQEERRRLKAEMEQVKVEWETIKRQSAYQQSKAKYANDPLAKRYEREVEAFSQQGADIDYEPALYYILGQKLAQGDLRDFLKTSVEQQTIGNIAKRAKTKVEGSGQSPRAPESRLSGVERTFANKLLDDVAEKPESAYLRAKPKK